MTHVQAVNTSAAERYLLDEMTELERHSFEEHFFSCPDCADEVRTGALMRDGVRAGFTAGDTALPAKGGAVLPFEQARGGMLRRLRTSVALPWAAAATLAVIVGYQSSRPRTMERLSAGPLALAPATLRPAARGEEPVVQAGPGGAVTLAVDLGGARFDDGVHYDLKRADGTVVSIGDVQAPSPGAPLLLVFFLESRQSDQAGTLRPSERYVLTLRNSQNQALTAEEYRFTVGAR